MKILFCNDGHTGATGDYYIKVLEERGHQVVTAGLNRDIEPPARTVSLKELLERCAEVDFAPDLIIEHESGFVVTEVREHARVPAVFIEADTPQHYQGHAERSKWFDYCFISQKDYLDYFHRHGNPRTYWLPFACDPEVHRPIPVPEEYDLAFVGHYFCPPYYDRARLLDRLSRRYRMRIASNVGYDEMALIYSQAKIVFNRSMLGIFNIRPFEAMSCGRLVLTDRIGNGLTDLFQDRKHLVIYGEEDLEDLIDHYLVHDEERNAIAQEGQREVHSKHTYAHRVDQILRTVFGEGSR